MARGGRIENTSNIATNTDTDDQLDAVYVIDLMEPKHTFLDRTETTPAK